MPGLPKIGVEAVVENVDGYKRALDSISKANDSATNNVDKTAKRFDVLGTAAKALGGTFVVAFGNIIANVVTGAFNTILGAINGIIGAVGNLASKVFDSGVKFSSTMANISSITKQTGKDLTQLGKDLIEVGADSAAGPQAVADAYYDVASGVLDASERMNVLTASIATAEAGQADLTAVTQGLVSVMNAYGKEAGGAAHVSDVFTATVATGVGTMDQFVGALTPLAGLAAANKISFTEMGGAISFMTAKGIPAEQAATALKAAIVQLSRNTPQVTKALKSMGEKSIQASIANHGLAGTLALLEQGAKKTHQNLTTMLGSVEALQAVTALGGDEFQKYFDTFVDGVDGATAAARELQRADVSYQLKLIGSRFQAVGLSISQAVLPAFNKFLTFINKGFANFNWKAINAGLDQLGEKLGNAAENLIGKLGTALESVDWDGLADDIMNTLSKIGDFFMNIDWTSVANMAAGVFTGLREGFFALQSVDWGKVGADISTFVNGAVTTVGGIVTAIQGVVTWVQGAGQKISIGLEFWRQAFDAIGTNAQTALNNANTFLTDGLNKMSTGLTDFVNGIGVTWNDWFGATGKIPTAVSQAITAATGFISAASQPVIDAIVKVVTGAQMQWDAYFGPAGSISTAVSQAIAAAEGFINGGITGIENAINGIVNGVTDIWNGLFGEGGSVSTSVSTALATAQGIINGAVGGVQAAFNAIANAIMKALAPALAFIQKISDAVSAVGNAMHGLGIGLPGGASGGYLQEGANVVGERGPEVIMKTGSRAVVIPANKSKGILQNVGNITPLPKAPGMNLSKYNAAPAALGSGPMSVMAGIMPQPVAIAAGNTNTYNNSTTNNNNSNVTINGVPNAESALQRMAMMKASGQI